MACKRTAAKDLNHENWNDEDEPEEAGTFVKAPQEVLEKRVVKAARRRLPARSGDGPTKSAFGSFAGFKTTPTATASPFSFLASANKSENPLLAQSSKSPSNATATSNGATKIPENGMDKPSITFPSMEPSSKSQEPKSVEKSEKGEQNIIKKSSDHHSKLKDINESVSQWITSRVPENGMDNPSITFPSMEPSSNSQESKSVEKSEKGDQNIFKKSSDYYSKLKGLNESVTQWIKSHVDSNPFCILSPIFRDYERYLKEIETNHGRDISKTSSELPIEAPTATSSKLQSTISVDKMENDETVEQKTENSTLSVATTKSSLNCGSGGWNSKNYIFGFSNANAKSIFGNTSTEKTESKTLFGSAENNPFLNKSTEKKEDSATTPVHSGFRTPSSGYMSFSQTNTTNTSATFSFGQSSTTNTSPSAGFSFGSSKPFSFGSNVATPKDSDVKADTEEKEDEDEPPKVDFKPVKEEDAFFEKRCKVFVKKEGNFSDRGIGILFLKSTPNGKTQLIVRANNNLGNILINTLLTSSIPTKRMNKNTVMLVCLPLPVSEPPPTPVLLRVKTSEDADALIEALDNNKK